MLLRGYLGNSTRSRRCNPDPLSNPDLGGEPLGHKHPHHPKSDSDHHRDPHNDGHAIRASVQDADIDRHTYTHPQRHADVYARAPHSNGDRHARSPDLHLHSLASTTNRYRHSGNSHGGLMSPETQPTPRDRLRQALIELATIPGPSGYEGPIREKLHKLWSPISDRIEVSRLGNLAARIDGTGSDPRPAMAIVAHMDTIGFMVSRVDGAFLRISGLGTPDPRVLLGQTVTVLGRQPLPGIIVRPLDSDLPDDQRDGTAAVEHLLVDVARDPADVARWVRAGDLVVFDAPAQALGAEVVIGPGLDNRASLAAVTEVLASLHDQRPTWDVWVVATTREEQNVAGAATSGFEIAPQLAVAVDATFGRGPQDDDEGTFPIGAGLTNGVGPVFHSSVRTLLAEAADRAKVPLLDEVLPGRSGTDADELQVAGAGIPTGLLSLPIRNMHTCVEMVHLDDVLGTSKVLLALARGLDHSSLALLQAAFNDD